MDNVKKFYIYLENTDDTKVLQIIPWNGQSSVSIVLVITLLLSILLYILHEYAIC